MSVLRRWSHRRRVALLAWGALPLAALPLAWSAAATGALLPPGSVLADGAVLSASSARLAGLVYAGTVTVPTTAGEAVVLELTSTSASLTGLALHVPCRPAGPPGGMKVDAVTGDSTSTAEQGMTVYATSVSGTAGGSAFAWTPDTPPGTAQLGDVAITDLVVELVAFEAPTLTTPSLRQSAEFC
ncbi:MAG TPA: hypothetical protein VF049_17695 [Nocardioidaceae bacterium]|jgi:hypothetical protein